MHEYLIFFEEGTKKVKLGFAFKGANLARSPGMLRKVVVMNSGFYGIKAMVTHCYRALLTLPATAFGGSGLLR